MTGYDLCKPGEEKLSEDDRKKIVARIHSLLFWVGKLIPEQLDVDGKTIPLRDVVYRYVQNENPSPSEVKDAIALATMMEKRAQSLEEEIKHVEALTRGEACDMMKEACGLLRAVDEIRSSDGESARLKRQALMSRVEDVQRWRKFLKEVR